MNRIFPFLLILAVSVGCADDEKRQSTPSPEPDAAAQDAGSDDFGGLDTGASAVTSVAIEPQTPSLAVGDRLTLVATPLDATGNEVTEGAGIARWESSNPAVAPVSSRGEVLGASSGTTTVTATYLDVSSSVELTVTEVGISSVEVLPSQVVFTIGDTFAFIANPLDADGEPIDNGLPVAWRIEDESIATISTDGTVTALAAGSTNVIATVAGIEGRADVIVEDAVLTGISIDQPGLTLAPTTTGQLTVSLMWQADPPASEPTVTWTSSDDSVAEVRGTNVVGISPGTATITAEASGLSDTIVVTVVGDFDEIATGADHACARIRSAVFCWGDDSDGQLGHDQPAFGRAGTTDFEQVVAGRAHTCARTPTDEVWCWGANNNGQLGLGDTMSRITPTKLTGTFSSTLRAHGDMTCAGTRCWGDLPSGVETSPTNQTGELFVGGQHSCVITGGTTVCSGSNDQGQLGINSTGPMGSGTPVGGYTFSSLRLGDAFSCGIVSGGGLACWGDGDLGQIGDSNFSDSSVPILVPIRTTIGAVETGTAHVCVRLVSGDAQCWGANLQGQLGDSGRSNRGAPTDVDSPQTWSLLSVEANHSCGLDDTGTVWCWGNGNATPVEMTPNW